MTDLERQKVLIFGSSNGRVVDVISQINKLNGSKAGPFDLAILLGNVIPPETLEDEIENILSGEFDSSIPVYFSDGPSGLHKSIKDRIDTSNANELTNNLMYLGPGERVTTINGLSIFNYDSRKKEGVEKRSFDFPVDILFGFEWPTRITELTEGFPGSSEVTNVKYAQEVAEKLKPRYHFVCDPGQNIFWERHPFYCDDENRITRFISLADFQTKDRKWFYAFKIDVKNAKPAVIPKVITANPYPYNYIPKGPKSEFDNIWQDTNKRNNPQSYEREDDRRRNRKSRKQAPAIAVNPENCFFCLSNLKIDRALIASIADDFYVALAKGPLIAEETKNQLGCPGHVLIIPMSHVPTYKSLVDGGAGDKCILEKRKYEIALRQMYSEHGLHYVSFEINRNRGVHIHTQVIPVPEDRVPIIESTFIEEGERSEIFLRKREVFEDEEEYFKVTLPDSTTLIASIDSRSRFDLQFGRRVLAIILGIEEQIDWRACSQTLEEEKGDCREFKKKFKSYDFSL